MWDLLSVFTEIGEIDAAIQLLEKYNDYPEDLMSIRMRITPNGVRLQCDPRINKLIEQSGTPPSMHPVNCNES
jgi:hypothetical protein